MNELITVNNIGLQVKEFQSQRVVTFQDIDIVHERPEGTAKRNFAENRERFVIGEDYFIVSQKDENRTLGLDIPNRGITVFTEQGYLMLVKSLTDDLAWEVQRQLIKTYFRAKKLSQQEIMRIQLGMIDDHEERINHLENTMTVDFGQQRRLQNKASYRVLGVLGGAGSPANKDRNLKSKAYSAIWRDYKDYFMLGSYRDTARLDFDKATEYLNGWCPQGKLLREIEQCNRQMNMEEVI